MVLNHKVIPRLSHMNVDKMLQLTLVIELQWNRLPVNGE